MWNKGSVSMCRNEQDMKFKVTNARLNSVSGMYSNVWLE